MSYFPTKLSNWIEVKWYPNTSCIGIRDLGRDELIYLNSGEYEQLVRYVEWLDKQLESPFIRRT